MTNTATRPLPRCWCGRELICSIEGDREHQRCPRVASHWWTYILRGNHDEFVGPVGLAVMRVEWR